MNGLPSHLLDEILFKVEPKSLATMRCTNKYFQSCISDPKFEKYSVWTRSSLFHLSCFGATYIFCLPLASSRDSMSLGNEAKLSREPCYLFSSCSGLLLLYIGGLFVVNPLTKRFRLLDHSGSKFMPDRNVADMERAMCVGFTVNRNRSTKRFKIVCIHEMETVYAFEISDGYSWRLSETTITTSSKSDLMVHMKPVYLDDTLHWLRNDGSIIAFNPDTEQASLIPCIFHREPKMKLLFAADDKINRLTLVSGTKEEISVYTLVENSKWTLPKRIKNVYMKENELVCWNIVVYDSKHLVLREQKHKLIGVVHVYDMEVNSWGVLGSTTTWASNVRGFYKFTPSLFFVEEDEQQKVIVASNDKRVSYLTAIMRLIDTTM
ncbi:PREDICTED: putative F-box/kelch-repeat protein At1g20940 [Camelina sativa]|uniref:F-box/kelch-repeat protein At1g20940 n=1 Tax=Camelina sativa TaxID=90675 RepID=A0ABM0YBA7_CAMSA|nr:PREDICTED: putative F-box/kelch-repeat protein At1g20940 [Camelina sativa]